MRKVKRTRKKIAKISSRKSFFAYKHRVRHRQTTNLVTVTGDVRLPGTYPLLQSREISELIELAGGFEASAYLDRAEVTRLSFEADGTAILRTIAIPLADVLSGTSEFS